MKTMLPFLLLSLLFYSCENKPKDGSKTQTATSVNDEYEKQVSEFLADATEIAKFSQQVLGNKLKTKMMESGPIGALEFCSVEAIPITDSLSGVHGVQISRVSDKNRNPENTADDNQLAYIRQTKEKLTKGEIPEATTIFFEDHKTAYVPIVTNAMCIQCHGVPGSTLDQPTFNKIKELYPHDKAVGYSANELRGIWVIEELKN